MTRPVAVATALLFFASTSFAHDLWIVPSKFKPAAGDIVTASLLVGQKLHGEPLPRIPPLVDRFVLWRNGVETPMVGRAGADPAGAVRVAEPGVQWIGYQSNSYPLSLEAAKFTDYLREEGLEHVIEERAKSGQAAAASRERFYRCAKALVSVGNDAKGAFDKPLGFTLELIPRSNPYALRAGGKLPIALLFRGKPIANILVVAMNRDDPADQIAVRTDAKGRATIAVKRPGFWLIKAVHMQAAPAGAGVDWESWWASITFELAP